MFVLSPFIYISWSLVVEYLFLIFVARGHYLSCSLGFEKKNCGRIGAGALEREILLMSIEL